MEDRRATWQRTKRRMQVGLSGANVVGAATVFVFLTFLVPVPHTFTHNTTALWLNGVLSVVYVVAATVVATTVSPRRAEEIRRWFLTGRPADRNVRDLALRTPLRQAEISAAIWGVATVLFTAVNAFESGTVAVQTAITVPLGGLASGALTYLLAERFSREITAAALAGGAPEEPVGPGVGARVIVAWGLAAGLPLSGYVLLAVSILVVGHWSPTHIAISVLIVAGVALALGSRAMWIAGRSVSEPIEAVRAAQRRVQSGDLETEIPVYDGSEVGLLQAGFNEMTAGLRERERICEAFGTYLDGDVAEHILERGTALSGEELEITAMFIDVRNFTGFAERASAREVVAALNRLFELVVPIVHRHGGHVDKFVGDGLLAVFGAPQRQSDHADQALSAALDVARAVGQSFGDELQIGIGLSSGSVIAGNVGGGGRLEFSVIGDAVNVAALIEAATRQTGDAILVSEQTRAALQGLRDTAGKTLGTAAEGQVTGRQPVRPQQSRSALCGAAGPRLISRSRSAAPREQHRCHRHRVVPHGEVTTPGQRDLADARRSASRTRYEPVVLRPSQRDRGGDLRQQREHASPHGSVEVGEP